MLTFRNLTENEIDVRVQQIRKNGLVALLYKDARVDQNILDETVGPECWQRDHYEVKGNLFCQVGIFCPEIGWVWKSDCGVESFTEKEKGEASDSFKRACFNWGIGRELYTAPFVWIPADNCTIEPDPKDNSRLICKDRFKVTKITIENKTIVGLVISNETRKATAFSWGANALREAVKAKSAPKATPAECPPEAKTPETPKGPIPPACLDQAIEGGPLNGMTYKQIYKAHKVPDLIEYANQNKYYDIITNIRLINAYIEESKK